MAKLRKTVEAVCTECGLIFVRLHSGQKYCGDKCRQAAYERKHPPAPPIEPRACKQCGKVFTPVRRSTEMYCSSDCRRAHLREQVSSQQAIPCKWCKTPFYPWRKDVVYCSKQCQEASMREMTKYNKERYRKTKVPKQRKESLDQALRVIDKNNKFTNRSISYGQYMANNRCNNCVESEDAPKIGIPRNRQWIKLQMMMEDALK